MLLWIHSQTLSHVPAPTCAWWALITLLGNNRTAEITILCPMEISSRGKLRGVMEVQHGGLLGCCGGIVEVVMVRTWDSDPVCRVGIPTTRCVWMTTPTIVLSLISEEIRWRHLTIVKILRSVVRKKVVDGMMGRRWQQWWWRWQQDWWRWQQWWRWWK